MKKSTKAALLSAFVFPGAGHFYLKKYLFGTVLAGATFFSIYYLVVKITETAEQIVEQMQTSGVSLDVAGISDLASAQSAGNDSLLLNIASTAVLICWIIGIIDSYRAGSEQDKAQSKGIT